MSSVDCTQGLATEPDPVGTTIRLTGRLTQEPATRVLADGTRICDLRLAVEHMGSTGVAGTIDVATFGKTAASCQSVLSQGWLVGVAGRLEHDECLGDAGSRHGVIGVVVSPLGFDRSRPVKLAA